jgi:hypothetical protein
MPALPFMVEPARQQSYVTSPASYSIPRCRLGVAAWKETFLYALIRISDGGNCVCLTRLPGHTHLAVAPRVKRVILLRQNGVVLPIGMAQMWPCQNTASARTVTWRMASRTLAPRVISWAARDTSC